MLDTSTVLGQALDRLDLIELAEKLGHTLKIGVQSRPGEKEAKPSFSVFRAGDGRLAFKDHATGKGGGCWQLVQLLNPSMGKKEIARTLIVAAGLNPDEDRKDHRALKDRTVQRRREYAQRHERAATAVPSLPEITPWPAAVRDRWDATDWDADRLAQMDTERGWLAGSAEVLVGLGKVADPIVPWKMVGEHGAMRGFAFLVEAWDRKRDDFIPLGYHQRIRVATGRTWLFVPYMPKPEKASNEFLRGLSTDGRSIPPLPFVLGNPLHSKLWVILEGQWDAISFAFAAGRCREIPDAFVLGLRGGSSGIGAFFAHYGNLLASRRPRVWLISDNDRVGQSWAKDVAWTPGAYAAHTLRERCRIFGASGTAHTMLRPTNAFGKDFNDWYKAAIARGVDIPAAMARLYKQAFPEGAA